jgi:uncharacterized membrane-anchored protein YjiN (DUF445 family)
MRRRATGLLAAAACSWLALRIAGPTGTWAGYARAGLEASMVGGLADWFAVTALFRHPLGLPIPHTAVVVERKDQFGRTLAGFFRMNFLSGEAVADRLRTSRALERAATWSADPVNAETVARHILRHVGDVLDATGDDVAGVLVEEARRLVADAPLAPLASTSLRAASSSTFLDVAIDRGIDAADSLLGHSRAQLADRFTSAGPWWLPDAVQRRVFDQLFDAMSEALAEIRADSTHPLRGSVREQLALFADRIDGEPELGRRVEELKAAVVDDERVEAVFSSFFTAALGRFHEETRTPGSRVERRLVDAIQQLARRIRDDASARTRIEDAVEVGVSRATEIFGDDIDALVTGTIARWDAERTADQLELLLGSDLQFIRINGTVVGGLAGLLIYGVGQAIG